MDCSHYCATQIQTHLPIQRLQNSTAKTGEYRMHATQYNTKIAISQPLSKVFTSDSTNWHCRREYNRRVKEVVETSWMEEPDADDK